MQFTVNLSSTFDQIVFVGEREEAEKMISDGWTPVWEPGAKIGNNDLPNYSNYFILVQPTKNLKGDKCMSEHETKLSIDTKDVTNNLNEVEQLALIAKGYNFLDEIVETLIEYECSALEARELLKGVVQGFDEAFQEHPDKMYETLKQNPIRSKESFNDINA